MQTKFKWVILTASFLAFMVLLAAGICLLNKIFPQADPIRLPDDAGITGVYAGRGSTTATIPVRSEDMDAVMEYLSNAKPTRKQSLNDHPDTGSYYSLVIHASDMQYRYFVYEHGAAAYAEVPYEGIYAIKRELLDIISSYLQEA